MLTSGGDRRITVARGGNTNVYGASPFPRATLGYSASTANDISFDAFHHLESWVRDWPAGGLIDAGRYGTALESFRARLRAAWQLGADTDAVFAPSGTDLEYVALSLAAQHDRPVTNILLGQDEVGSGCILSSAGRYFAQETAVSPVAPKGEPIRGFGPVEVVSLPVRDAAGAPVTSAAMADAIARAVQPAIDAERHALVHVVHGSKTGLVLPRFAEIDALRTRFGEHISLVVDACQARIEIGDLHAYLARGAVVLLTGSKFIGGPPFSGFALVPCGLQPNAALPAGLASVFRRAEWPVDWRGCDHLPEEANPGLLLRIEAALFELDRFRAIDSEACDRVTDAFAQAVRGLAGKLGADLVEPAFADRGVQASTLATLDLSRLPGAPDIAVAQRWCRVLSARGLRLGQPVKCLRRADGGWAGTLRLSLSMPMIATLAPLDARTLTSRFERDMVQIADVLQAAQRPVAL
jgi:hypothetical protein